MKMGERFGLETKDFFTAEPIFNTERPGLCSIWNQTEENISKPSAVYPFNFQQVTNGVSCHKHRKYLRACAIYGAKV